MSQNIISADLKEFMASWSREMIARANQVRHLIGSNHWLTDGRHKEKILGEFFSTHLPSRIKITSGFILPVDNISQVSRETDLIFLDSDKTFPLLSSGDFSIIPPEGVLAHIHVKATLNAKALDDSLDCASRAYNALRFADKPGVIGCIFAYNSPRNLQKLLDKRPEALKKITRCDAFTQFIIVTLDGFFAILKPADNGKIRLILFNLGELAVGALLANLISFIGYKSMFSTRRPDLLRALPRLGFSPIREIPIDGN